MKTIIYKERLRVEATKSFVWVRRAKHAVFSWQAVATWTPERGLRIEVDDFETTKQQQRAWLSLECARALLAEHAT